MEKIMGYHIFAFGAGFLLDMFLGDPSFFPHPVRLIGSLIEKSAAYLEAGTGRRNEKKEVWKGTVLVIFISGSTLAVTACILFLAYRFHPYAGAAIETIMTYQIFAAKCLKDESMKVYASLQNQQIDEARKAVSMIVGRDTECLDEEGIIKAAIETVAENTSDGVIAPMLYTALGGPVLGLWYKAVNTMDSMIGYKNERYLYFGRAAARLDDLVNFIPSRICACLMILASFLGGRCFSGKRALAVYARDKRKHASPNSAQTESVCAGALGIQLAGNASYFGKIVEKPLIGDALRRAEQEDIRRVNRLMYLTVWMGEMICLILMLSVTGLPVTGLRL